MEAVRSVSEIARALDDARSKARFETIEDLAIKAKLKGDTIRAWMRKTEGDLGLIAFAHAASTCGVSVDSLVFGDTAKELKALDTGMNFDGVTADQKADLTQAVRLMTDICRTFNHLPADSERLHPARVLLNFIRECQALAASLSPSRPESECAQSPHAAGAPSKESEDAARQAAARMRSNMESEAGSSSKRAAQKSRRKGAPPRS